MACSRCSGDGSSRITFSETVQSVGGSLPALTYLHCAFRKQFNKLFTDLGFVDIDNNLKVISYLRDSGGDKTGLFTNGAGKQVFFSVDDTLAKIDPKQPDANTSCKV